MTLKPLAPLLVVLAAACAARGGGQDGETHGDLMSSGGDAGNLLVMAAVSAVSAPLEVINLAKDWERIQQDEPMPWIAADRRVEAYAKDRIPTGWDLNSEKYRWKVGDDLVYPFHKYTPRVSDFIVAEPISKNWEFSGERVKHHGKQFSRPELMPDYTFYLVSIEPMAVVMVPTGTHRRAKYLPNKRQKLTDWGAIPDKSLKYSTRFPAPAGRQPLWFSPDLKVKVQPVAFDQPMDAGALRLTCTRDGDTAECRRIASPVSKPK